MAKTQKPAPLKASSHPEPKPAPTKGSVGTRAAAPSTGAAVKSAPVTKDVPMKAVSTPKQKAVTAEVPAIAKTAPAKTAPAKPAPAKTAPAKTALTKTAASDGPSPQAKSGASAKVADPEPMPERPAKAPKPDRSAAAEKAAAEKAAITSSATIAPASASSNGASSTKNAGRNTSTTGPGTTDTAGTPAKAARMSSPTTTRTDGTRATKAAPPPPLVLRPVKLLKAPALNPDDPFDGIDELSEGQFLTQQRESLLAERATYTQQAEMLRAEADLLVFDMEPGDVQFDDESGEGTGVSVERERDLAMSAQAYLFVDEIDRALIRIATGAYGYCESCQEPIMRARLRAMPFATQCISCKNGGLSRR